jgi:hypothetical protein
MVVLCVRGGQALRAFSIATYLRFLVWRCACACRAVPCGSATLRTWRSIATPFHSRLLLWAALVRDMTGWIWTTLFRLSHLLPHRVLYVCASDAYPFALLLSFVWCLSAFTIASIHAVLICFPVDGSSKAVLLTGITCSLHRSAFGTVRRTCPRCGTDVDVWNNVVLLYVDL